MGGNMEIIIFLFVWMLLDNILLVLSQKWRKNTIRLLLEYDSEMENYWKDLWINIKKLLSKKIK